MLKSVAMVIKGNFPSSSEVTVDRPNQRNMRVVVIGQTTERDNELESLIKNLKA